MKIQLEGHFLEPAKQSKEFRAAVDAIRAVPVDVRDRAVAEGIYVDAFKYFERGLGKRTGGRRWWGRVFGRRAPRVPHFDEGMPAEDHPSVWLKDGKYTFVFQPYDIYWDDLKALVKFCEKHNLEARICATSWHFPMRTVAVVVTAKSP